MIRHYLSARAHRAGIELDESGFTLIELLIVIVVLGILAAVVIFSLSGVTASSAVSACNSDGKTVEIAVAAYDAQQGNFPTTAVTDTTSATTAGLVPTYLHTWPDNGNSNYSFSLAATTGVLSVTVGGTTTTFDSNDPAGCAAAT